MTEFEQNLADSNPVLTSISPLMLLVCFAVIAAIAFISARAYRNTNDFKKSAVMYAVLAVAASGVYYIIGIPGIIIAGYFICGFIFTALISNHYFYS